MMTERRFQRELAKLMKACPNPTDAPKKLIKAWRRDFDSLLWDATDGQARRALDLYELHVRVEADARDTEEGL